MAIGGFERVSGRSSLKEYEMRGRKNVSKSNEIKRLLPDPNNTRVFPVLLHYTETTTTSTRY